MNIFFAAMEARVAIVVYIHTQRVSCQAYLVLSDGDTAVVQTQYTVVALLFGFRQKKRED